MNPKTAVFPTNSVERHSFFDAVDLGDLADDDAHDVVAVDSDRVAAGVLVSFLWWRRGVSGVLDGAHVGISSFTSISDMKLTSDAVYLGVVPCRTRPGFFGAAATMGVRSLPGSERSVDNRFCRVRVPRSGVVDRARVCGCAG